MTAHQQKSGPDEMPAPPASQHELNYAMEVLQKEFPKLKPDKILWAWESARASAHSDADRWQLLHRARALLGDLRK